MRSAFDDLVIQIAIKRGVYVLYDRMHDNLAHQWISIVMSGSTCN